MPTIGNNVHTLLDGLSDFWVRFWADIDELKAIYKSTEVVLAQAYLDLLSSFLNISISETPLFNKKFFKLLLVREDQLRFQEGASTSLDRYILDLEEALVRVNVLQNKVANPTASLERQQGYDVDDTYYELEFYNDPAGEPLRNLGSTIQGNLLTFGTGIHTEFYTVDEGLFAKARTGYWLQIVGSGAGNDDTYEIAEVLSDDRVLLKGTFTLPDPNSGALTAVLYNSEFMPIEGFAQRRTTVAIGGSFDDSDRRAESTRSSWYARAPLGLGVRKGDIVRILDKEALPTSPKDYHVSLIRHNKMYFDVDDPLEVTANNVDYVLLRRPHDTEVLEEASLFSETAIRPVKTGIGGSLTLSGDDVKFTGSGFDSDDKLRYLTVGNGDPITWQANLSTEGVLTYVSGLANPLVRAFPKSRIKIGVTTYTIGEIADEKNCLLLGGPFEPLNNVTATLEGITNDGVYRIKEYVSPTELLLDVDATLPDPNNGSLTWRVHDGYRATLVHSRLIPDTLVMYTAVGDQYTGGKRPPVKNLHYRIDLEKGQLIQIGRLAGSWGTNSLSPPHMDYEWLAELSGPTVRLDGPIQGDPTDTIDATNRIITFDQTKAETALAETNGFRSTFHEGLKLRISSSSDVANNQDYTIQYVINSHTVKVVETPNSSVTENFMDGVDDGVWTSVLRSLKGSLDASDTTALVTEVAMWAPDVEVDKFNLYTNYGYLLNRFQASSEAYRGFIRGVFQLYILGPALERIESALNAISGNSVIRDDGEVFIEYDTSDPEWNIVRTVRLNSDEVEYRFPKSVPIRDDIQAASAGDIIFEAFEPLTELFQVTDYVQDPTWWESIVIPITLIPEESTARRTTFPILYENVIGSPDYPKIGDPGLFIGADDEGVVPAYGDLYPAVRRKFANVVMDRFLKHHIFYVRFDTSVETLLTPEFVQDLRELVLIAKPGYKLAYVEPASEFLDTVKIEENFDLTAHTDRFSYLLVGEQTLTIQSGSWNIGDVWRKKATVPNEALLTANGLSIPAPVTLVGDHVIAFRVKGPQSANFPQHYIDFDFDYAAGTLTPTTIWPAGVYTIEYSSVQLTAFASKDASLGDTDYVIGGLDPERTHVTREMSVGALVAIGSHAVKLVDPSAEFHVSHEWVHLLVHDSSEPTTPGLLRIEKRLSDTEVIVSPPSIAAATTVVWSFRSDEPTDGWLYQQGGLWYLKSDEMIFRKWHKMRYLQIINAVNSENDGFHKILDVVDMRTVQLEAPTPVFVPEVYLHIKMGKDLTNTDLLERPVQIRQY